jgi:hydrogenase maturation protease
VHLVRHPLFEIGNRAQVSQKHLTKTCQLFETWQVFSCKIAVMKILIVALGQELRGDDAAGIEAVRRWQARHHRHLEAEDADPTQIRVIFAGLPGVALLDLLEKSAAAILVDAVQSDSQPGTIRRFDLDQLAAFQAGSGSAHGWGVAETLALGQQLGLPLPHQLVVIGIDAGQVELGASLSPAVEAALPDAVCAIQAEVDRLLFDLE